jgi:hypothetical protein
VRAGEGAHLAVQAHEMVVYAVRVRRIEVLGEGVCDLTRCESMSLSVSESASASCPPSAACTSRMRAGSFPLTWPFPSAGPHPPRATPSPPQSCAYTDPPAILPNGVSLYPLSAPRARGEEQEWRRSVREVLVQGLYWNSVSNSSSMAPTPSRVTLTPATYLTMHQKLQGLTLAERT